MNFKPVSSYEVIEDAYLMLGSELSLKKKNGKKKTDDDSDDDD